MRRALEINPAAHVDKALLVRLVWELRDGYLTNEPRNKLTNPWDIIRAYYLIKSPKKNRTANSRKRYEQMNKRNHK